MNYSELSEPDEQQPRVVHAGLEDAVNLEKSTSIGILSAQARGFVSQDFQAKLDQIDVALGCFETSKVTGLDKWDNRAGQEGIRKEPTKLVGTNCHSKSGRLGGLPSDGLGSTPLKRPREDSSEELRLVNVERKKQVVDFKNLMVEAEAQPH